MPAVLEISSNATDTVSGGSTNYIPIGDTSLQSSATTEANQQVTWRTAGTFKLLYVRVTANSLTGSAVFRTRKNTANGNLSVSVAAGTTGEFKDNSNSDTVASGDVFNGQASTGTGTSISFTSFSLLFSATSTYGVKRITAAAAVSTTAASATSFHAFGGTLGNTANEGVSQIKSGLSGSLLNYYVNVTANSRTNSTTFGSRLGGVNGGLSVSVASTTTGIFEDTSGFDSLTVGSVFNSRITTGTGTQTITYRNIAVDMSFPNLDGSGGNVYQFVGASVAAGNTQAANTTGFYFPGGNAADDATESDVQVQAEQAYTASLLQIHVASNGVTAASTFTFRKNGNNGNQTVSVTASGVGNFQDGTNTDSVGPNDEINYQLVTGSTGTTVAINNLGHLATVPHYLPRLAILGIG